jgi:hypothetical protein
LRSNQNTQVIWDRGSSIVVNKSLVSGESSFQVPLP